MKGIKKISRKEWERICDDYKGVYQDYQGTNPELKGKRTMLTLTEDGHTALIFEGIHFIIVD